MDQMKKVLLLGDSIRMGYDDYVKELLSGKCAVYYDGSDNGRFAAYTLWQANQLFKQYGKFDVVHWNNGYWDMNVEAPMTEAMHPVDEYLHFLRRIIGEIRRNGAQIIFATTTPVLSNGSAADNTGTGVVLSYDNDWVKKYNDAAKALMAEQHVPVNDLYTLMLREPNYCKCADKLHLTEEGYKICAEQAARMIEERL
jgi:Lysophospholipase L1 and related esterases